MLMMASIIAICGSIACTGGEFGCKLQSWPDISHVMGVAPRNKLYSIMLTIYSCTKQAEARAYHDKLSAIASPLFNNLILLAATASFIFGPLIGYFDCYYDMDRHMLATQIFTIGEVIYVFSVGYLLATNRSNFSASVNQNITNCVYALCLILVVGLCMSQGNSYWGISMNQIGEWIAFYSDFFIRYNFAIIMRYTCKVVPSKNA